MAISLCFLPKPNICLTPNWTWFYVLSLRESLREQSSAHWPFLLVSEQRQRRVKKVTNSRYLCEFQQCMYSLKKGIGCIHLLFCSDSTVVRRQGQNVQSVSNRPLTLQLNRTDSTSSQNYCERTENPVLEYLQSFWHLRGVLILETFQNRWIKSSMVHHTLNSFIEAYYKIHHFKYTVIFG